LCDYRRKLAWLKIHQSPNSTVRLGFNNTIVIHLWFHHSLWFSLSTGPVFLCSLSYLTPIYFPVWICSINESCDDLFVPSRPKCGRFLKTKIKTMSVPNTFRVIIVHEAGTLLFTSHLAPSRLFFDAAPCDRDTFLGVFPDVRVQGQRISCAIPHSPISDFRLYKLIELNFFLISFFQLIWFCDCMTSVNPINKCGCKAYQRETPDAPLTRPVTQRRSSGPPVTDTQTLWSRISAQEINETVRICPNLHQFNLLGSRVIDIDV